MVFYLDGETSERLSRPLSKELLIFLKSFSVSHIYCYQVCQHDR